MRMIPPKVCYKWIDHDEKLDANSDERERSLASPEIVGEGQHPDKMQGHWILARAGKRVLRPGGLELTQRMLDTLAIGPQDRVVEFAPGLGVTARIVLQCHQSAYWGVEREPAAAEHLRQQLSAYSAEIVPGQAEESGLPDACATVVYGEAMLEYADSGTEKSDLCGSPAASCGPEDDTGSMSYASCLTIFQTIFVTKFKRLCQKKSMRECNRCPRANG